MRVWLLPLMCLPSLWAALPPELPGTPFDDVKLSRPLVSRADPEPTLSGVGWKAPSIEDQMRLDPTLLGVGQGAVFVPAMTEGRLEPTVEVLDMQGHTVKRGVTGTRLVLDPGRYQLTMARGDVLRQTVDVVDGKTTVIRPNWSGLLVEVINADGEYIAEPYDVYNLSRGESEGRGYGREEGSVQNTQPWILRPGLYRLAKVGTPLGSNRDYITVQLNSGEVSHVELVLDQVDGSLLGGGVLPEERLLRLKRSWTHQVALGGNIGLENKTLADGQKQQLFTTLAEARWRSRFDNLTYYGNNEVRWRSNFRKENDGRLLALTDEVYARTFWVRRLNAWVGPYVRARFSTHVAEALVTPEKGDSLFFERPGIDTTLKTLGDTVRIRPPLYPIALAEGAGLSFDLLRNSFGQIGFQSGFAARQVWQDQVWVPIDREAKHWRMEGDAMTYGLEEVLDARFRIFSRLGVDLRGELFLPDAQPDDYVVEELSADIRLTLSRFAELSWLWELTDSRKESQSASDDQDLRFRPSSALALRFFLSF